jgi:hypothetical protein
MVSMESVLEPALTAKTIYNTVSLRDILPRRGTRLALPTTVSADWLTSGSGTAGCPFASSELDPEPAVDVTEPRERRPSAPMGTAATAFCWSFVRR